MPLFVDGEMPTKDDMERLRLLLSTYQDGSGMLKDKITGGTRPGWRDFERAAVSWVGGFSKEGKHIYDVHLKSGDDDQLYGYSCKMRGTLSDTRKKGDATIEVTNADADLWTSVTAATGVTRVSITNCTLAEAEEVGCALVRTIQGWHDSVCHTNPLAPEKFISEESPMLHLAWEASRKQRLHPIYKLIAFDHHLPSEAETAALEWSVQGGRLQGLRSTTTGAERCIEWYFSSGGQVKYYPRIERAIYVGEEFSLEPLDDVEEDLLSARAFAYWPELWGAAAGISPEAVEAVSEALEGQ